MAVITMEVMDEELIVDKRKFNILSVFHIAMILIIVLIAIILVSLNISFNKKEVEISESYDLDQYKDANLVLCDDEEIINFIETYFEARKSLKYEQIFRAFNKDYNVEIRTNEGKEIVKYINYEHSYVRSYDNIKIYETKGLKDTDKFLLIVYDLNLGFAEAKVPMVLICYLEYDVWAKKYYILNDIDIRHTKYINYVTNTSFVKETLADVEKRIERILISNDDVKLAYNSLRQYDMNGVKDIDVSIKESYYNPLIDPIKNSDEIYKVLKDVKESEYESKNKKDKNDYISESMILESIAAESLETATIVK